MMTMSARSARGTLWCLLLSLAMFSAACTGDDEPEGNGTSDPVGADATVNQPPTDPQSECQVDMDCGTSFVALNACEESACELGKCVVRNKQDGISCNPGDLCTVNAQCTNGSCMG
ncbi:MAG: hypothetical protein VX938_00165, partial [Myxococcota bacterium]|nr:hypothetical protein [Myxococcota bacterium]